MALINIPEREITCKIVYYGTGLGGKTANLRYIYRQLAPTARTEMVSLATETERTLFFDYLGLDLGQVKGFTTRFSLYTVPGQVEYGASRKLVLNGADGVIFVADSDELRRKENVYSLHDLFQNMQSYGMTLESVPLVIQYNKRDLSNAMNISCLETDLNVRQVPSFEAIASEGIGVFATLKCMSKQILNRLQ